MNPATAEATQHCIDFMMQMQYECLPYEVILFVSDNDDCMKKGRYKHESKTDNVQ